MQLYAFFRSSASYRVRIGLNLKGLPYEIVPVKLSLGGGENREAAYRETNAQQLVPTLVDGDVTVSQSLAIFDLLERRYPDPPLFPQDDAGRARVLSICLYVACEIQPLQNLRTERYLEAPLGLDEPARAGFKRHFQTLGLDVLEEMAKSGAGQFLHGDQPTAADCYLVPQAYSAERNGVDLGRWPVLAGIVDRCRALPAFQAAAPEAQKDAPVPR